MTLEDFLRHAGFEGGLPFVLGICFIAGIVASAVCPCTLPVGLGVATVASASETKGRRFGFKIATAFFIGVVLNLTLLGALAGRLGVLASQSFGLYWALIMAAISMLAALAAFFGARLKVNQLEKLRRPGLAGALGYGFIFSLGTSVAPLLLLLAVSAGNGNSQFSVFLAFAFGLGRGLPFLLAGLAASLVTGFTKFGRWRRAIEIVSGCALLIISAYYANTFVLLL